MMSTDNCSNRSAMPGLSFPGIFSALDMVYTVRVRERMIILAKSVVLAEKPSVARDIAGVLKCHKKGNGYLEGDKYIVTWALGHLVTLADPESYDNKYKQWKLEDLPMLPEPLKLTVIKKSGKQFNAVKSQLIRKDVDRIIVATDVDISL